MYYQAIVSESDGIFAITIPDLPGFAVQTESCTLDQALAETKYVLRDYLAAMHDHDRAIPPPRTIDALRHDKAVQAGISRGAAMALIPAIKPGGRTVRISLTIDEYMLDLIDHGAKERGLTRSAFLADAARAVL